jgi:hypothetical protein
MISSLPLLLTAFWWSLGLVWSTECVVQAPNHRDLLKDNKAYPRDLYIAVSIR